MYYVYRDFSIAGWLALAKFLLFAAGVACGRRGCRGPVAWFSLGGVAVIALALVFGARFYLAVTDDVSLQDYFDVARQLFWIPAVVFLLGLVWGWHLSRPPKVKGPSGFEVVPLPPQRPEPEHR
jgi:hypothetical protein